MTWEWGVSFVSDHEVGRADLAEKAFFQKLRDQISRLVRRYVRASEEDVEDLTQECLIRVLDNLDRLRESESLDPWLRAVVYNTSASWLRERYREKESQSRYQELTLLEAPVEFGIEDTIAIQQALNELEEEDQQILHMRYYLGMRYAEIGAQLNLSEECIRKRVNRSVARLRQHPIIRALIEEIK